jgi:hypothetical protein
MKTTIDTISVRVSIEPPELGDFYTENELPYFLHDRMDEICESIGGMNPSVVFELDEYSQDIMDRLLFRLNRISFKWTEHIISEINKKIKKNEGDMDYCDEGDSDYLSYCSDIDAHNATIKRVKEFANTLEF